MNIFKKVYCRIFQTGFYIALPFLPYREPKIYQSVEEIPNILKNQNIKSILLVTDKVLRDLGISKPLETVLKQNNINCIIYDETLPNPTTKNVEDARKIYLGNNCQAIVTIGGGSSIDCAKAVGARISRPKKSLDKLKGLLKVRRNGIILVILKVLFSRTLQVH